MKKNKRTGSYNNCRPTNNRQTMTTSKPFTFQRIETKPKIMTISRRTSHHNT